MGRKIRETSHRAKNHMETDENGKLKPRGSRDHQTKAVPQRRALPKDKTASKRRQHSGGEATRHSRKEIDEGRIGMSGRSRDPERTNNIGSKGKGQMEGKRRKLRQAAKQTPSKHQGYRGPAGG